MTAKNLRTLVYHLLLERPQTGYSIAKEAEARTGWRPSWGSIYPLLDSMQKQGLISVEEKGRSKEYHLTQAGKAQAQEHVSRTKEIVREIAERLEVLQEFCDEDISVAIQVLRSMEQTGKAPFSPIRKEAARLRFILYEYAENGTLKERRTEINKILQATNEQLESLR